MTTALPSKHRSDVPVATEYAWHRDHAVLNEQILLSSEGDENASRGLGIDFTSQRCLTGADCGLLLGAVSAPIDQHLISIGSGVELSGKSKPCPNSDGLIERLCKHCILLCSLKKRPYQAGTRPPELALTIHG
jgi:hypothetical protein